MTAVESHTPANELSPTRRAPRAGEAHRLVAAFPETLRSRVASGDLANQVSSARVAQLEVGPWPVPLESRRRIEATLSSGLVGGLMLGILAAMLAVLLSGESRSMLQYGAVGALVGLLATPLADALTAGHPATWRGDLVDVAPRTVTIEVTTPDVRSARATEAIVRGYRPASVDGGQSRTTSRPALAWLRRSVEKA